MAQPYSPANVPLDYDPVFLREELKKISAAMQQLESPNIRLNQSNTAPDKPQDGDVYNADGTNWNPGSGAGLYEYIGGSWNKL